MDAIAFFLLAVFIHLILILHGLYHSRDDDSNSTVQYAIIFGLSAFIPIFGIVVFVCMFLMDKYLGDFSIALAFLAIATSAAHIVFLIAEFFAIRDKYLRRALWAGLVASVLLFFSSASMIPRA